MKLDLKFSRKTFVPDFGSGLKETENAVLIIRMRERQSIDETTVEFIEKRTPHLHAAGN